MIVAIKLIGIFLGVLAPYFRKVREGKIERFERRHLASSIGSLVLGIIITLLIFPSAGVAVSNFPQFQAGVLKDGLNAYIKLFCRKPVGESGNTTAFK